MTEFDETALKQTDELIDDLLLSLRDRFGTSGGALMPLATVAAVALASVAALSQHDARILKLLNGALEHAELHWRIVETGGRA